MQTRSGTCSPRGNEKDVVGTGGVQGRIRRKAGSELLMLPGRVGLCGYLKSTDEGAGKGGTRWNCCPPESQEREEEMPLHLGR